MYDKELYAENVVVKIQIPKNSTNVKTHTNKGKGKHEVDKSSIIWRLKKIFGRLLLR